MGFCVKVQQYARVCYYMNNALILGGESSTGPVPGLLLKAVAIR